MERWKAVDMARKRRAPKYTGALAQPIYLEDHYEYSGGLGQPNEPDEAAITKEQVEKMRLLFKHYKVDLNDEQRWRNLAMSLALAHVPGLQVVSRPKPGPKSAWKTGRGDLLVSAVEERKSRTGKSTTEAIAELQKEPEWKRYTVENLGARYQEARAWRKALASLREDWEKEIAAPFTTAVRRLVRHLPRELRK
jgi:hypothetical protein